MRARLDVLIFKRQRLEFFPIALKNAIAQLCATSKGQAAYRIRGAFILPLAGTSATGSSSGGTKRVGWLTSVCRASRAVSTMRRPRRRSNSGVNLGSPQTCSTRTPRDHAGCADGERYYRQGCHYSYRNALSFDLFCHRCAATITTPSGGHKEHAVDPCLP